jgi:hypothetical protein
VYSRIYVNLEHKRREKQTKYEKRNDIGGRGREEVIRNEALDLPPLRRASDPPPQRGKVGCELSPETAIGERDGVLVPLCHGRQGITKAINLDTSPIPTLLVYRHVGIALFSSSIRIQTMASIKTRYT